LVFIHPLYVCDALSEVSEDFLDNEFDILGDLFDINDEFLKMSKALLMKMKNQLFRNMIQVTMKKLMNQMNKMQETFMIKAFQIRSVSENIGDTSDENVEVANSVPAAENQYSTT
jgi:hypothetical protein